MKIFYSIFFLFSFVFSRTKCRIEEERSARTGTYALIQIDTLTLISSLLLYQPYVHLFTQPSIMHTTAMPF